MLLAASNSFWFREVAPHIGATPHDDFKWGVVHGLAFVPNFCYSLFVDHVTLYQLPNTGAGYNSGFVFGAIVSVVILTRLIYEITDRP